MARPQTPRLRLGGAALTVAVLTSVSATSGTADAATTYDFRDVPLACNTVTVATTYDTYRGVHHGHALDFPVAGGTPVLTPVRGTVAVHQHHAELGNWVEVVDHTTGETHRLAHLRSSGLRTDLDGKYVAKGVTVGLVGETGLADGEHLHYALYNAAGAMIPIDLGGRALSWDRTSGPRTTTFQLRSKNCRSTAGRWVLTNSLAPHVDTDDRVRFGYGTQNYIPVAGDWNGDGVDTAGVFAPATGEWVLTNSLRPDVDRTDRIRFSYGNKNHLPVVGDWDGDGVDSPGVFNPRSGNWVLTNSIRPDLHRADRITFKFGNASYLPVAGNWDGYRGSTNDTPGVYNPASGNWVLTNSLQPDVDTGDRTRFRFGGPAYLPVAGDWDGHPGDNPGVVDITTGNWVLTNSLAPDVDTGNRVRLRFGGAVWSPVAGNWDGHPGDNPGVFAH